MIKPHFAQFVDHILSGNARYWLGETYYVRKNYVEAARIFLDSYAKFRTGDKAPDSLLKLGLSLAILAKTKEACLAFKKLKMDFPNASEYTLTRLNRAMAEYSCR